MVSRLTRSITLLVLAVAGDAAAQQACTATVREVVDSSRVAATVTRYAVWDSAGFQQFEARLDTLAREYDGSFAYGTALPDSAPRGFRVLAKHTPTVRAGRDFLAGVPGVYEGVQDALLNVLRDSLVRLGRTSLVNPVDCVLRTLRQQALNRQLENLRRFERKFGPSSVKLNFVEVLANYGLQFLPWPKLTGVDRSGSPRPWEAVVAYRTTYLTLTSLTGDSSTFSPQAVSSAEFGLRHYNFGESWGTGSSTISRMLKPGYWSLGFIIAPERNGALRYPWRGESRWGPYLAWGNVKIGWLSGHDRRVVVSREVMLVPYVF
ncbi:MAG: hypothetical protein ACT4P6_12630 [Gemmatimonadaceae bacterium]